MNFNWGRGPLFLQLNPAFIIVAGLLNGIVPFYYFSYEGIVSAPVISVATFILVFALLKLFDFHSCFKQIAKFAIFTVLGWSLAYNAYHPSRNNYVRILPGNNCAAEVKAVICDATDPSANLEWMPRPATLKAEVIELRISQNDKYIKSFGLIVIKLPEEIETPAYGDVVIIKGAFVEPEKALFYGAFDYKRYLLAKGVRKVFYATSIEKTESEVSYISYLMCHILHFRDHILDSITKGMDNENRKMMAAIFFGCRQGVDYESRKNFLQSGVIHIFAISGLHVGMLALALYMLFRWAPFKFRYLTVPFLLFVYVITTGLQPSALRALLMISLWSFMKGLFYRTSSLNIVFLAASIMLLFDPLSVLSAGFQFSFIIAFFLVLSWQSVKDWSLLLMEKQIWIPSGLLTFRNHFTTRVKNALFNSFITTLIAWLSGSALLLFYRSFFIPGAVFTNFIIIPFVWMLFFVALIDLLIIPFHFIFSLNGVLEFLLNIIRSISIAGADGGGGVNIVTPHFSVLILFFVFLFFFVISKKRIMFIFCTLMLFLIISFCCFSKSLERSKVACLHGGESQEPAFISIPSGEGYGVTVINPGSKTRSKALLTYLHRNGINSIDYLIFTENRKSCCEGAWAIFSGIEVKHVIFPSEYKRSRYAKSAVKNAREDGVYITLLPKLGPDKISCGYRDPIIDFNKTHGSGFFIKLKSPEGSFYIKREKELNGEKQISIFSGNYEKEFSIINSSKLKLITVE